MASARGASLHIYQAVGTGMQAFLFPPRRGWLPQDVARISFLTVLAFPALNGPYPTSDLYYGQSYYHRDE